MNIFCRLLGHTWVPDIETPQVRWNTTKDGQVLTATADESPVRHLRVCRRCGLREEEPGRRHDADRPAAQPEPLQGKLG